MGRGGKGETIWAREAQRRECLGRKNTFTGAGLKGRKHKGGLGWESPGRRRCSAGLGAGSIDAGSPCPSPGGTNPRRHTSAKASAPTGVGAEHSMAQQPSICELVQETLFSETRARAREWRRISSRRAAACPARGHGRRRSRGPGRCRGHDAQNAFEKCFWSVFGGQIISSLLCYGTLGLMRHGCRWVFCENLLV